MLSLNHLAKIVFKGGKDLTQGLESFHVSEYMNNTAGFGDPIELYGHASENRTRNIRCVYA